MPEFEVRVYVEATNSLEAERAVLDRLGGVHSPLVGVGVARVVTANHAPQRGS